MNFSDLTLDKVLAIGTTAANLVILVYSQFAKAKDTYLDRLESDISRAAGEREKVIVERDKLAERIAALEALRQEDSKRIDNLEQELAFYRLERKEMANFLDDIIGDSFSVGWIKTRAKELKARYNV